MRIIYSAKGFLSTWYVIENVAKHYNYLLLIKTLWVIPTHAHPLSTNFAR